MRQNSKDKDSVTARLVTQRSLDGGGAKSEANQEVTTLPQRPSQNVLRLPEIQEPNGVIDSEIGKNCDVKESVS